MDAADTRASPEKEEVICMRSITVQDKLVLTLLDRREYRSMENIAAEYGVSRDTIADNIHWVERALLNANLLQNSVTCVYKTN